MRVSHARGPDVLREIHFDPTALLTAPNAN